MKLPEPRLKMEVKTQTVVFDSEGTPSLGDLELSLDTTVPASGEADRCGKVAVVEDSADATHLVASLCGTPSDGNPRIWEIDFVVPKKKGRSTPEMTVLTALVSKRDDATKDSVCSGALTVKEVTGRGLRTGSITGSIVSPSCTTDPPDATFLLDRADFELRTAPQE